MTILAAIFAVVVYYGHFVDVYRTALKVRSDTAATVAPPLAAGSSTPSAIGTASLGTRVADALGFAAR